MKRIIALVLTLTLFLSFASLGTSAAEVSLDELKFMMLHQTNDAYSYTGDMNLTAARYQMRGMAISHDAKYSFGGYLNPAGSSAIEMFDNATGKVVGGYQKVQTDGGISYPKGLATDDRGYLYAALAPYPNYGTADLAVIKYDETDATTGFLKEIAYVNICKTGEKIKTGVNGITVEKVNGVYYAYVVVNYDVDYLYRFDITIPTDPVIDTTFGDNGFINLQAEPYNLSEGNYLDVDEDGTIYLGVTDPSKNNHLMVLSENGKTVINTVAQTKAYGVAVYNNYVFVSSQNSGNICVYDKSTLALIKEISVSTENIVLPIDASYQLVFNFGLNSLCNLSVKDDILFLGDQGSGQAGFDQILAVGLTTEAAAKVASWASAIEANLKPEETTAADTTKPEETTKAPEETTATPEETPAESETKAPEATKAPETTAPEKGGCGAAVGLGVAIIALFGTAIVFKKR